MERTLTDYKDFDITDESGYDELKKFLADKKQRVDYELRNEKFRNYVDNRVIQRVYLYN